MRKYMTVLVAVLALGLLGATPKEGWPVCSAERGPETFNGFMQAIARQDEFAIEFYTEQRSCGTFKSGLEAEILETLPDSMVRVRIHLEDQKFVEVWTVKSALEE